MDVGDEVNLHLSVNWMAARLEAQGYEYGFEQMNIYNWI